MAETKILGYDAAIDTEWQPLSEQHAAYVRQIDKYVAELSKGNRNVPRIAVVGAYGQGKTQLLFHIMKLVFKNGGIAIYTHADRILSLIDNKVGQGCTILPSDLPGLLSRAITDDLQNLGNPSKITLLTVPEVLRYVSSQISNCPPNPYQVLLIDEVEQAYELLQQRIMTSDRNPIRSLLDSREVYTVLAFAPRSIYEYKLGATLGEGEAERSRFETFYLPPVTSQQMKIFLNIPEKGFANFLWWMGRGRARFLIKAFQQSQVYSIKEQRGFQSFVEAMGKISGVPCFDLDALMDKSGRFTGNWKEIFSLIPFSIKEYKERALLFRLDEDFDKKAIEFYGKLGFTGSHAMMLSAYLRLLLDAVSGDDKEAVIKKKDSLAIIRATYELALEHTHDEKLIGELQKRLDDLQAQSDLKYSLPDMMEEAGIIESVKPDKLIPFDFDRLLEFFPFPLSSPQLPDATKEDVEKWLSNVSDLPLAEDEESSVIVLFFKDLEHLKRFCENEKHAFVEKVLSEKKRTTVFLMRGEIIPKDLPALVRWLKNQDRLQIERLRPSLLADFLANALYLVTPDFRQPRMSLRKELSSLERRFEEKNDRATVGKVVRYLGALNELISALSGEFTAAMKNFTYERKGVAFEGEFVKQRGTEAFPYPLILAFFGEDTEGLRALAQVRSLVERAGKPLLNFLPEKGGYRTSISFLPTTDRKGVPRQSDSIEAIRNQYKDKTDDLGELVRLVTKEEISYLVEDELTKYLLQSYHDSQKFRAITPGEKETICEYLQNALETQRKILEQEGNLKLAIGMGVEASLKFSTEQEQAIRDLREMIEKADKWRSVIYQRVFFTFAEQLATGVKEKADEFWKTLNNLPPEDYRDLVGLAQLLSFPDQMSEGLFKYIGISRDKVSNEIKKKKAEIEKDVQGANIDGLEPQNVRTVHEYYEDLTSLKVNLEKANAELTAIEEILNEYRQIRRD